MTDFFTIYTRDIYGNLRTKPLNTTEIYILAEYVNNLDWPSPIGIPDISNWVEIYGKNIAGIAETNKDGTYKG